MTTEMRARIAKLKRRERALLQACEQAVLNSTLPKDQKVKINPILKGCGIPIQAFAMSVYSKSAKGETGKDLYENIKGDFGL